MLRTQSWASYFQKVTSAVCFLVCWKGEIRGYQRIRVRPFPTFGLFFIRSFLRLVVFNLWSCSTFCHSTFGLSTFGHSTFSHFYLQSFYVQSFYVWSFYLWPFYVRSFYIRLFYIRSAMVSHDSKIREVRWPVIGSCKILPETDGDEAMYLCSYVH
jgi:hypothetical protein